MKCRRRAGLIAGLAAALAAGAGAVAAQCKLTLGSEVASFYQVSGPDYYGYYTIKWGWYGIRNCGGEGASTSCPFQTTSKGLMRDPVSGRWITGFQTPPAIPSLMQCGDPPLEVDVGPSQRAFLPGAYDLQVTTWWGTPYTTYLVVGYTDNTFNVPL